MAWRVLGDQRCRVTRQQMKKAPAPVGGKAGAPNRKGYPMTVPKKSVAAVDSPPEETVLEAVLDTTAPDERLFIMCGCGHRAAHHADGGCRFIKPAVTDKSNYQTKQYDGGPCACPTPREVVYICGRTPAEVTS